MLSNYTHILRLPAPAVRSRIMKLAVPIMLASLSQTLMSLFDIAMVGQLGAAAVAAVGLGGMLTYSVSAFLNSIQAGTQTVIARREGDGRHHEIATTVKTTMLFSLLVGSIAGLVVIQLADSIFPAINDDPDVVGIGISYLKWRNISLGPVMAGYVFYAFYNGISQPRIHLIASVIANSLNVLLNYCLIFGRFGFPELGAPGAGLATAIASIVAFAIYAGFTRMNSIKTRYKGIWLGPMEWPVLRKVLDISMPAGVQNFGVLVGFAFFMIIMGWVSTVALAATEIVFNILSFSFMPAMGFLYAAQTLVSENMGRNDFKAAEDLVAAATKLCMLLMGAMGVIFMVAPRLILRIFTPVDEIITAGAFPLVILGAVQFFDAIGMVHLGALRGAGDNGYPAKMDLALMWGFFVPATFVSAITFTMGINGGWLALAIYIISFAYLARRRFQAGQWKLIIV